MKTQFKKMLALTALGVALLANTTPTWAGSAGTSQVTIQKYSNSTSSAFGSLVGARYSADSRQYIGCQIFARANTSATPSVSCYALDSAGNSASCFTSDAQLVDVIQGMTDSSAIRFDVNNSTATCNNIRIYNQSIGLP